jgi:hypothetical protein
LSKLIELHPLSLTSKWGFDDGDVAYQPLDLWAKNSYFSKKWEAEDQDLRYYLHSHTLLAHMVEQKILPLLPQELINSLDFSSSIHNPITLEYQFPSEDENRDLKIDNLLANLPSVEFTQSELNKYCQELFPLRGNGYLKLYSKLINSYGPHKPTNLYLPYENKNSPLKHPAILVKRLLDDHLEAFSDQDFEIISIIYNDQESKEEFQTVLELARKL